MKSLQCNKFRKLAGEQAGHPVTKSESAFLEAHRTECADCREYEQFNAMAMNLLRESAMEPEFNPNFEDRILRKLRVQTSRASIGYWSPAVVGAFVAGLAIVAALQLITRSADLPRIQMPGGEARNMPENGRTLPFDRTIFKVVDR